MVYTAIHYIPSAISALLIIFLALRGRPHRGLALAMALFALLGLAGYLSAARFDFIPWISMFFTPWLGMVALLLSLAILFDGMLMHSLPKRIHCQRDNDILLACGINDLTLSSERGFPLQLAAKSRFGYKWITGIEVVDREQRGYWESREYSNGAKVGEFPFG